MARAVAVSYLMLVAAGCSETQPSITSIPAARDDVASAGSIQEQTQLLASAIADALSAPSIRSQMRHAMRDSRWTDHKLVLQDYLQSTQGKGLLHAMASAMGVSPTALTERVNGLPSLDFYLPFRANRVSWRGAADYLVGSTFDKFAPSIEAFDSNGSAHTLRLADGAQSRPLVILHPGELKSVIPASEPRSTGEAIENAAKSGTVASTHLFTSGAPAAFADVCPPDAISCDPGDGGAGDVTPPAPGVYLIAWDSKRGDGWFGSLELEFRSYGWEGLPQFHVDHGHPDGGFWVIDPICPKGTLAITTDKTHHDGALLLVSPGITNVSTVSCGGGGLPRGYMLEVVEMDGGLNGNNDDFGRRFFYGGTAPFNGVVSQSGTTWETGWQDYYSGGGNASYPEAQYSISLSLQYRQ